MEQQRNKGFGLLFEMGCGKTLTAIAIAGQGYKLGKVKKLLVVAPASVVSVWPKEFDEYADFPYIVRAMQGTAKKKVELLHDIEASKRVFKTEPLQVAVINYESAWRTNEDKPKESIFDALIAWKPDMVICDESQKIKTNTAEQSKAMHKIGDTAKYKLILSGTPIQSNAMDIWSQYRFLDPTVFGDNFYKFRARYGVMGGFNGKQVVGTRDTDILTEKAHSIAYRVTKEDALDLPEKTFLNREVEMSPKEQKLYNQIKRECYAEIEGGEITAAMITTKLLRLQQITGGFAQFDDEPLPTQIGNSKLKELESIINDYVVDAKKKLVVFAQFTAEVKAICKLLDTMKGKYGMINGSVKQEDRGAIIERFQKGDTMVMVGQIQAAGTGITLHASSCVVYYSLTYNYATYAQSTDRIHRIGQHYPCTYIHLVCPKTVDMQILRALSRKEELAKSIVDNWRCYFGDE